MLALKRMLHGGTAGTPLARSPFHQFRAAQEYLRVASANLGQRKRKAAPLSACNHPPGDTRLNETLAGKDQQLTTGERLVPFQNRQ